MSERPEPLVLGAAVLARKRANVAVLGPTVVDSALDSLPADLRATWDAIRPMSWVSLELVEKVQDTIARAANRDPEELHDQVIRRSVEEALRTIYRVVLRFASDDWLVSRTSTMYRRTRKLGTLSSTITAPGHAELLLTEWPQIRERWVRQIAIGIERVLTLTGRRNVEVVHARTGDGARFKATWSV